MDHERFDDLMRMAAGAGGSRRSLLRLLAAGALGGVATRLGLAVGAEARPHRRKAAPKRQRNTQAARNAPGQFHAERQRKKSGKGKPGKDKPKPPNPVCDNGLPRCPDGSCRSASECCPGSRRCEDGVCRREDKCCPSQKSCPDKSCVAPGDCCEGEIKCDDGSCIPYTECCPPDRSCGDLTCVGPGECCENERPCDNGSCTPLDTCCQDEKECDDGRCVGKRGCCPGEEPCNDGLCPFEGECCPEQKMCPNGRCYPKATCCSDLWPLCQNCYDAVCDNGAWACRGPYVTSCQCPNGGSPCPPVPARTWTGPDGERFDLPQGCCPPGHMTRWDPTTGSPICVEELYGETGWTCW